MICPRPGCDGVASVLLGSDTREEAALACLCSDCTAHSFRGTSRPPKTNPGPGYLGGQPRPRPSAGGGSNLLATSSSTNTTRSRLTCQSRVHHPSRARTQDTNKPRRRKVFVDHPAKPFPRREVCVDGDHHRPAAKLP